MQTSVSLLTLKKYSLTKKGIKVQVVHDRSQSESNFLVQTPKISNVTEINNILYPLSEPRESGYLRVSDLHQIYYEEYGDPGGKPAVYVHGGPGGGALSHAHRYFDPEKYRIVCFDQRGAMRSKPFVELRENNTQNLIKDMDALRRHLNIDQWLLFGGSWVSCLSLAYAETYPEAVTGLVLRGITFGERAEVRQVYNMNDHFPELWQEMAEHIPEDERDDLVKAYNKRLNETNDEDVMWQAAQKFGRYDLAAGTLLPHARLEEFMQNKQLIISLSKLFVYYSANDFFLKPGEIYDNLHRITHLPLTIVHGRYDVITRPKIAYKLHKAWPGSKLIFTSDAGHSEMELSTATELVRAVDSMVV